MRITVLTYGTRGDVQPYVALSKGLMQAGYAVRLAAPEAYAGLAAQHGADFAPLPGDISALTLALSERAQLNPAKMIQEVVAYAVPLGLGVLEACMDACEDADAIIHSFLMTIAGNEAAVRYGVPSIAAEVLPVFAPTDAYPAAAIPAQSIPGMNRLSHHFFHRIFWEANRISYAIMRRTAWQHADLPPLSGWPFANPSTATPVLLGISPHILGNPQDYPANVTATGFWTLDAADDWLPGDDLLAFLDDGPPPICVSFGSALIDDADSLTTLIIDANRKAGQRVIVQAGWNVIKRSPSQDVFYLGNAPHDWLFARARAVVYHGGAGTTAAVLKAGIPAMAIPFGSDQRFWGQRVEALGIGPAPVPRSKLTVDKLAYAVRIMAEHGPMRARAAALGAQVRLENGVNTAVGMIDQLLNHSF